MIVVFGTVCLDRVRRLPHLPPPGGYVEATEETMLLGGEALNTALALKAWGSAPVLASNPLGDDAEGEDLRERVRQSDLDVRELRRDDRVQAPVCDVLVTPDGERTMIGRGFSALDGVVDLDALPLAAGGLLTADTNMKNASREAVRKAHAAAMRAYLMDFLEESEPIRPNDVWQTSATKVEVGGDLEAARRVARARVERTGAFVVVTDGALGLAAGGPGSPVRVYPAFPAPHLVDSTGAGDVFRAGVLFGLGRNWSFSACLQFAAAAGALSVGSLGAAQRLPDAKEIFAHIAAHPDVAAAYV